MLVPLTRKVSLIFNGTLVNVKMEYKEKIDFSSPCCFISSFQFHISLMHYILYLLLVKYVRQLKLLVRSNEYRQSVGECKDYLWKSVVKQNIFYLNKVFVRKLKY